jgi:hypothetical protein
MNCAFEGLCQNAEFHMQVAEIRQDGASWATKSKDREDAVGSAGIPSLCLSPSWRASFICPNSSVCCSHSPYFYSSSQTLVSAWDLISLPSLKINHWKCSIG